MNYGGFWDLKILDGSGRKTQIIIPGKLLIRQDAEQAHARSFKNGKEDKYSLSIFMKQGNSIGNQR